MPDRKTVFTGKAICAVAAHLPWTWSWVSPLVLRFFDRAARGWDDRTGAGSPEHLAPLAAGVLKVHPDPERLLDLGCGTGAGTLFLAREYPRSSIRGLDLSAEMISLATAKIGLDPEGRVAFRTGDAAALPYPDDSFDLVTQTNMPLFFGEIARVLRPGGWVVIAHSLGSNTPFSTPERTLERKFAGHAISKVASGQAGEGTWFLARLEPGPAA